MLANLHHTAWKFSAALSGATLLLTAGLPALRTIADLDICIAQISLELCDIGISVLRVCGI
jgi:hypothetical protein